MNKLQDEPRFEGRLPTAFVGPGGWVCTHRMTEKCVPVWLTGLSDLERLQATLGAPKSKSEHDGE